MKTQKKHTFAHRDPELIVSSKPSQDKIKPGQIVKRDQVPGFVYRDLKRTGYIIGGFLVLLTALYFVQTKTELLDPVLKFFGI